MKLIVGLGNSGRRYQGSRHNIGFMVIEEIAKRQDIHLDEERYGSLIGRCRIQTQDVAFGKPLTYMNESGTAVAGLVKGFGVSLKDVLVICDDMNLDFGVLRIRAKGSSGGHRGLASIIETLQTQNFARLRVGIGRPVRKTDAAEYVLDKFGKQERLALKDILEAACLSCIIWLTEGIAGAMNKINAGRINVKII